MMHKRHLLALGLCSGLPLTGLVQPAWGQPAASLMEEVIVTARKREQSLQDVSVSVMALPESLLQDAQLTDSADAPEGSN